MCSVSAGPVHSVHLIAQCFDRHIDEETWVTVSGATPNNIRGYPVIPRRGLFQQAVRGIGVCQVGAYEVESLCRWVHCCSLFYVSMLISYTIQGHRILPP